MSYLAQTAETVRFKGHDGDEIEGYLARPNGEGPYGSIVLLHHAPAWDEPTIEMARKFAHHGYVAVAPHLYSRQAQGGVSPEDAAAAARAAGGTSDEQFLGDAAGALDFARGLPYTNGRVAVIGFCSGGRQAYLAGCRLNFDAVIDCWGGNVMASPEQLNAAHPVAPIDFTPDLKAPLLGIFGGEDYNPTRRQVEMTEEVLRQHGKAYEFHVFDGAGHSFMTTDELNFRVKQTVQAWERIFDFMERTVA